MKTLEIWLWEYIKQCFKRKQINSIKNIAFCICDHFEPMWNQADEKTGMARIRKWIERYPLIADQHKDSRGNKPKYTFFYPQEWYKQEFIEELAILCRKGYGEVEIHLHHDNDTAEGVRVKLEDFKTKLVSHGLLGKDENGKVTYGFVHGNWALDNSRKDGKWCGVNNEIAILKETGCYADFTMPSAPSDTQTKKINSIYYATDDPNKPKSHDWGIDIEAGRKPSGDLMIIQGPLCLNWKHRKFGVLPKIENGELSANNPPTPDRIDLWVKQGIGIKGRPDWIFIKVYTHGCQEANSGVLLNKGLHNMFTYLENKYNDGNKYRLFYVTARGMYNIIRQLERGEDVPL